jgi:hypothetical protein
MKGRDALTTVIGSPRNMKLDREHLTRLVRLKWALMAAGATAFFGFGLTGAMLAEAGWKRTGNVLAACRYSARFLTNTD